MLTAKEVINKLNDLPSDTKVVVFDRDGLYYEAGITVYEACHTNEVKGHCLSDPDFEIQEGETYVVVE